MRAVEIIEIGRVSITKKRFKNAKEFFFLYKEDEGAYEAPLIIWRRGNHTEPSSVDDSFIIGDN